MEGNGTFDLVGVDGCEYDICAIVFERRILRASLASREES